MSVVVVVLVEMFGLCVAVIVALFKSRPMVVMMVPVRVGAIV